MADTYQIVFEVFDMRFNAPVYEIASGPYDKVAEYACNKLIELCKYDKKEITNPKIVLPARHWPETFRYCFGYNENFCLGQVKVMKREIIEFK